MPRLPLHRDYFAPRATSYRQSAASRSSNATSHNCAQRSPVRENGLEGKEGQKTFSLLKAFQERTTAQQSGGGSQHEY